MTYMRPAEIATKPLEEIIELLKQTARDGWPGNVGEQRAVELDLFIRKTVKNYSEVLGLTEEVVLQKIEGRRDYSAINYYQESNFPTIGLDSSVETFETVEDLQAKFPSHKFVCPMCKGISTHPTVCNTGIEIRKDKPCDWKAFGFLGTMGTGYRFVIKHNFLECPVVHEIFKPVELAGAEPEKIEKTNKNKIKRKKQCK